MTQNQIIDKILHFHINYYVKYIVNLLLIIYFKRMFSAIPLQTAFILRKQACKTPPKTRLPSGLGSLYSTKQGSLIPIIPPITALYNGGGLWGGAGQEKRNQMVPWKRPNGLFLGLYVRFAKKHTKWSAKIFTSFQREKSKR